MALLTHSSRPHLQVTAVGTAKASLVAAALVAPAACRPSPPRMPSKLRIQSKMPNPRRSFTTLLWAYISPLCLIREGADPA